MAIVTIQVSALSDIQKKRIGERILDSLHREGIPASSIVVLFRPEDTDIYLDGGVLFQAKPVHPAFPVAPSSTITTTLKRPPLAPREHVASPAMSATSGSSAVPQKPRKAIPEYSEVKEKVRSMILNNGGLSSFQAQSGLDLKGYDGASAILRRVFAELELEGMVEKVGQKRGTRYVLKGITSTTPPQTTPVILVKQDKVEASVVTDAATEVVSEITDSGHNTNF